MKKIILICLLFITVSAVFAEPIDIYDIRPRGEHEEFDAMSMEDQYYSIMNTFKSRTRGLPAPYELIWAGIMVDKYGRDLLPLITKSIKENNLNHELRPPINEI